MTIDVNVDRVDEAFFEELEEIMEETMVQMFILHPRSVEALEEAKRHAAEHHGIFYAAPLEMRERCDGNCIGFFAGDAAALKALPSPDKPLFVDDASLDDAFCSALAQHGCRGVILNAARPHERLAHFYLSIGPDTVGAFETDTLNRLPMERIVLQSRYPDHGFDEIFATAKRISNAMFRPEQSIIAHATQSTLQLFGFRK